MVKQAEQFADADKKKREEIEILNQAETATYTVKKSLDELGDKVTNEERAKVEAAMNDLDAARNAKDIEQVKQKMDALYKAMEPISQKIYQQEQQKGGPQGGFGPEGGAQQQQQQQSQESSAGKDGDYVDADYKIVDDQ